jgi:hypothetical protein
VVGVVSQRGGDLLETGPLHVQVDDRARGDRGIAELW